jgi:hypothetical protein
LTLEGDTMNLTTCAWCSVDVLTKADGTCPSCRKDMRAAPPAGYVAPPPPQRRAPSLGLEDDDDLLRARRKEGDRRQLVGLGMCVVGALVTALSFASASEGGGRFILAWGAIVYGAIQIARGAKMSSAHPADRASS